MPSFEYRALNSGGIIISSYVQAKDKDEAGHILQKKKLTPISIREKTTPKKLIARKKISLIEKASFARYMGLIINSGLSMSEGIDSLASETDNTALKKILGDLSYSMREGKSVSSILRQHPDTFDRAFTAITKSGEISGTLGDSFTYLADKLKAEYELQRQIKGAMMYPIVILTALVTMSSVLMIFVLPRIGRVFTTLDIKLPLPTKILLNSGIFIQDNILLVLPAVFGLLIAAWFLVPRKRVKAIIIKILLVLPVTRNIIHRIDYSRLTRTLGILLKSGVSITDAIVISIETLSQEDIKKRSKYIQKRIVKGENLSGILRELKIFPAFITQMIIVGEKSGSLENVLNDIGKYYAQEVEDDLKNITQIIEPILILVVGILVGLMVISIIAPIYQLVGSLQIS